MIKFMLVSRRKPGDTQEKYFYEWGIIHVALMITTPSVMRTFRRYAQHFTVNGVDGGRLLYPLSDMAWDNFADHWLDRPEDNLAPFESDDYMQRMHPHNFGDSNFVIEYTRDVQGRGAGFRARRRQARTRRQEPAGPAGGRVRRRVAGAARRSAAHGRRFTARETGAEPPRRGRPQGFRRHALRARRRRRLRRHRGVVVRRPRVPAALHGGCGSSRGRPRRGFVRGSGRELRDGGDQRVVYDYTLGAENSPRPAVLDPEVWKRPSTLRSTRGGTCPVGSDARRSSGDV